MRKTCLLLLGMVGCSVLAAQEAPIASDVHAPLFQSPKSEAIASETARLAPQADAAPSVEVAHKNFIDDFVFAKMAQDGVPHAGLANDREFLRRVYLDLTGRIPSSEQIREFTADNSPDKRAKLIDALIGSPEFVDKWSYFFMDTLRINGKARISTDDALRTRFTIDGKLPLSVIVVTVESAYMHCAKAFMRSELWQPDSWPDRASMPTLGQILKDQLALAESAAATDDWLDKGYEKSMW